MDRADVLVVGGGIVGLATARAILRAHPEQSVVVVEKEASVGAHQSGRNSGVIHAGVYYQPGSDKARLCTAGRISMVEYCKEHGIDHAVCGKVVVAHDDADCRRLAELERRCAANGVRVEMIGPEALRELEPHVAGVAALHVLDTGIVDYADVCRSLAAEIEAGGRVPPSRVRSAVRLRDCIRTRRRDDPRAHRGHPRRDVRGASRRRGRARDQRARRRGRAARRRVPRRVPGARALAAHLVRALVYPVPDPQFPFLGVHLTRGIDGDVHVGPNAVLAFAREGYAWRRVDMRHLSETLAFAGFRRFARRNWRFGLDEMARSFSRRRFAAAARRLVPEIMRADLVSCAGRRAGAGDHGRR